MPGSNKANYLAAADVLHGWREDVRSGKSPTFYPIGEGELSRIEIGPGLVTLLGGAPGAGKTAFTMLAVVDALRGNSKGSGLIVRRFLDESHLRSSVGAEGGGEAQTPGG